MSFDPRDGVEVQWKKWCDENPPDSHIRVYGEVLRQKIIKDLTNVSGMDVKEYTLYQKWCEIKEKYPTKIVHDLWEGEKVVLEDDTQKEMIDAIRNNIWIPKKPEDYFGLKPVLIYTDDSCVIKSVGIDGNEVEIIKKRSNLPEIWNTIRTFTSTMKNNSNIGRNLNFLVLDEITNKYLGVICISSDFLDLTPRDNMIGWDRKLKTQGGMINHTAIGSTIVPLQPLGYNYVGGKLLALLCLSDEVQRLWKKQYGNTLVGVTTTSLYGRTKSNGLSQYDNLVHWQPMGFSKGSVSFEPSRETQYMIRDWLRVYYPRKYFEWYIAKKPSGQPHKRDHKNRSLNFVYSKLKIPKELIKTEHHRGIYFSALYENTYEFLRGEITEDKLVKSFDTSNSALVSIWKNNLAKVRIKQLVKKNGVSFDTLFYDNLIYMGWEECKKQYLTQVGR